MITSNISLIEHVVYSTNRVVKGEGFSVNEEVLEDTTSIKRESE